MTVTNLSHVVQPGDLVLLVGNDRKEFIVLVEPGQVIQTHRGVLQHDAVIGSPWGETVKTHIGYGYMLLPPSLEQLIRSVRRATQIIYPKEIGYLLMKMNIGPGTRIIEAGTGSGGLTLALARMVQPTGHVYTYEARSDIQNLAQKNVAQLGLERYVTFKLRDIAEGFDEQAVDAVFLDVREPWDYLPQAHAALKGGGFFGALVPTTNQVSALLRYLEPASFGFIEVEELILRPYKAVAGRLRPFDRIVAHTGYLIFARALASPAPVVAVAPPDELEWE
ncbi:MAG TPA: tRNA (adenine-N1)-methyltransferase [Anaerolineae bacterium]|nr:tRNA (adenine-N1)-methyltransferase [Anaerolineae bacterium]